MVSNSLVPLCKNILIWMGKQIKKRSQFNANKSYFQEMSLHKVLCKSNANDYGRSRYNHLARGTYSRVAKFQNGCHTLCQSGKRKKVINATEEYSIARTTKDATELDETLFKSKVYSFC